MHVVHVGGGRWCMWGEGGGACGRREVVHVGKREEVHVGGGRWCMWEEGGGACGEERGGEW